MEGRSVLKHPRHCKKTQAREQDRIQQMLKATETVSLYSLHIINRARRQQLQLCLLM